VLTDVFGDWVFGFGFTVSPEKSVGAAYVYYTL